MAHLLYTVKVSLQEKTVPYLLITQLPEGLSALQGERISKDAAQKIAIWYKNTFKVPNLLILLLQLFSLPLNQYLLDQRIKKIIYMKKLRAILPWLVGSAMKLIWNVPWFVLLFLKIFCCSASLCTFRWSGSRCTYCRQHSSNFKKMG